MLRKGSAHQQSAVRSARDRKVLRRGVFLRNQVVRCCEPVVEHILLLLEHTGLVPRFAVFAAATKIGVREPATLLKPPRPLRIPDRRLAQVEAAVTAHQQPFGSVLLQSFFAGDEHGNLRTILRLVEDLLELVVAGVEGDLRLGEDIAFSRYRVEAVEGWRLNVRLEAEEAVTVRWPAVHDGS